MNYDKTSFMEALLEEQVATKRTTILRILSSLIVICVTGCTSLNSRINFVPPRGALTPGTIQMLASSSISGHPMSNDPSLRDRVAAAFQKQFPGTRLVEPVLIWWCFSLSLTTCQDACQIAGNLEPFATGLVR
jgi:hypothetical protein